MRALQLPDAAIHRPSHLCDVCHAALAPPDDAGGRRGQCVTLGRLTAVASPPREPSEKRSVAARAVAVAVEVVDVRPDHKNRSADIGRTVPAASGTVHVTGNGDARPAVVGSQPEYASTLVPTVLTWVIGARTTTPLDQLPSGFLSLHQGHPVRQPLQSRYSWGRDGGALGQQGVLDRLRLVGDPPGHAHGLVGHAGSRRRRRRARGRPSGINHLPPLS